MESIFIKYKGYTLNEYLDIIKKDNFTDINAYAIEYYLSFLNATDYIANKLIESQTMSISCDDYTEELKARQFARDEINKLQKEMI